MTWLKLSGGLWLNTDQLAWVLETTLHRQAGGGPLFAVPPQPELVAVPGIIAVTADGERHKLADYDLVQVLRALEPVGDATEEDTSGNGDDDGAPAAATGAVGRARRGGRGVGSRGRAADGAPA